MKPRSRHVHQFRIGAIELERSRQLVVRAAYAKRVADIDERLVAIEREIKQHQAVLSTMPYLPGGPPLCGTDSHSQAVSPPPFAPVDSIRLMRYAMSSL
jgi:hypothetical protein